MKYNYFVTLSNTLIITFNIFILDLNNKLRNLTLEPIKDTEIK